MKEVTWSLSLELFIRKKKRKEKSITRENEFSPPTVLWHSTYLSKEKRDKETERDRDR